MTNLTDKWKKGELIEGKKYYCVSKNIADIFEAECCGKGQDDEWWTLKNEKYRFNNIYHINDIQVLALVPSYEEWQAILEENKRLKHDVGNLGYKIKNQRHEIDNRLKEINTLKGLLKELKRYFDADGRYYIDKRILLKINQVLGDKRDD